MSNFKHHICFMTVLGCINMIPAKNSIMALPAHIRNIGQMTPAVVKYLQTNRGAGCFRSADSVSNSIVHQIITRGVEQLITMNLDAVSKNIRADIGSFHILA